MKTKVTVIIPFYENFMLLKVTLNSVKNQSFRNYELILFIDNPENRENLKLIKEFIKKKIKILINNKNLGAGLSRNKGIRKAKGEFVAFFR